MSQEKVNKYKEQKANRKEILAKQKRSKAIRKGVTGLICIALIGWIGYSAVTTMKDYQPRRELTVDYQAVTDYMDGLQAE